MKSTCLTDDFILSHTVTILWYNSKNSFIFKCGNDVIMALRLVKDVVHLSHNRTVTHQRTEAGPCQRHGEGCHGNGAEVQDFGIYVHRRESLRKEKTTDKKPEMKN